MSTTYAYPARLKPDHGAFVVTFRDLPEALTQGDDRGQAIAMGVDALSTALWFRLRDGEPIPRPSRPRKGEVPVAPEPAIAMKLALLDAVGGRRGAAARIARGLEIEHKEARRLLDPTKVNKADRLARALELFGHHAVVVVAPRPPA